MPAYFPSPTGGGVQMGGLLDEAIKGTPRYNTGDDFVHALQREHDMRRVRSAPGRVPRFKFDPTDSRSEFSQRKAWEYAARFAARKLLPKLSPFFTGISFAMDAYDAWNSTPYLQPGQGSYDFTGYPVWAESHCGGSPDVFTVAYDSFLYNTECWKLQFQPLPGEPHTWGDDIPVVPGAGLQIWAWEQVTPEPAVRWFCTDTWQWRPQAGLQHDFKHQPAPARITFPSPFGDPFPWPKPFGPSIIRDVGNTHSNYVPPYVRADPKVTFHPGISVSVSPETGGGDKLPPVTEQPHVSEPNPPGEKQRKPRAKAGIVGSILNGIGSMDEMRQFIDALYKALPNKRVWFKGRDGKWHMRDFYPWEKAEKIYMHFDELDMGKALSNLAKNELQDRLFGYAGNQLKRGLRNAADRGYYRGLQGFQGGNYLRP